MRIFLSADIEGTAGIAHWDEAERTHPDYAEICADARALVPGLATVETLKGYGRAAQSLPPARARDAIRKGVEAALRVGAGSVPPLQGPFEVVVEFTNPTDAWRASWYPGTRQHGPRAVAVGATEFFEIQRALRFLTP